MTIPIAVGDRSGKKISGRKIKRQKDNDGKVFFYPWDCLAIRVPFLLLNCAKVG
jgi:hypothetical protein